MTNNKKKLTDKKKYSLYLFAMNEQNLALAMEYRFMRINRQYILVYTDGLFNALNKSRYHIIDESESERLSDSEKVWLLDANVKIITEESINKQSEIMQNFEERISVLEKELEKESAAIANGQDDDHE